MIRLRIHSTLPDCRDLRLQWRHPNNKKAGVSVIEDIIILELEDKEDTLWSKKGWDLSEKKLKCRLDNAFGENQLDDKQYWVLEYYATIETDLWYEVLGGSTYAKWKGRTGQSTQMLDKEFIKAMDGFAKLFEEGNNEKLEAMEKGGVDLRDQDRQARNTKR